VRTLVWAKQPCQRPRERSDGIPTGEDQTAVGHGTASSGLARLHLVRERVVADPRALTEPGPLVEERATEAEIAAFRKECQRIEALRDRILELGEEKAAEEYGVELDRDYARYLRGEGEPPNSDG
jgi:hypothetical protein